MDVVIVNGIYLITATFKGFSDATLTGEQF
jgi:hypothetical protein